METQYTEDETPIELTELEPSPVDETPSYYNSTPSSSHKADGYFPPTASSSSSSRTNTSTTFLGLSRANLPHYLRLTQKYTSITFSIFTAFHITNVSILPLLTRSLSESNRYLLLTRPYYQGFPLEPLLITIPLALHIASGIALRLHHRRVLLRKSGASTREDARRVPWPKLSGTSMLGYAAVPLVLGHAALTRMLPLWIEGNSSSIGLDYVGHGVALGPVAGFLGFSALVAVVGTHVVWGVATWAGLRPERVGGGQVQNDRVVGRKRRWWSINAVTTVVVAVWAAGGIGVVCRGGKVGGWVGKVYDDLYRHVPLLNCAEFRVRW